MTTEISARDKKLLVYLLAVVILAASYFFGAAPLLDKNDALTVEIDGLQNEVNSLLTIYNNQEAYTSKIAKEQVRLNEALEKFPSGLTQENTLMMLADIEESTGAWIARVSFSEEEMFDGSSESGAAVSTDDISEDVINSEITETNTSEAPAIEISGTGIEDISVGNLKRVKQNLSIDYYCKYSDFKRMVEYISNYKNRLFISTLSAAYSPDSGLVSGTITLSQYAVYGTGKELEKPDLSGISMGTDNIFTTLTGTNDVISENPSEEYSGEITAGEEADGSELTPESVENTEGGLPAPENPVEPGIV